jgi:hypothetical protein
MALRHVRRVIVELLGGFALHEEHRQAHTRRCTTPRLQIRQIQFRFREELGKLAFEEDALVPRGVALGAHAQRVLFGRAREAEEARVRSGVHFRAPAPHGAVEAQRVRLGDHVADVARRGG